MDFKIIKDVAHLNNSGIGTSLVKNAVGPTLSIKSISSANGNIIISSDDDNIILNASSGGATTTLASGAGGQSLVKTATGPALAVKSITAGSNVTLTATGETLTINSTGGGGATTTLDSGAGGQSLVKTATGPALAVKSITAGSNVTLTSTGETLTINSTGGGGATTTLDSGTGGQSLVKTGTGPALAVKSITAGSNVTLTSTGETLTINSTGGGGNVPLETAFYFPGWAQYRRSIPGEPSSTYLYLPPLYTDDKTAIRKLPSGQPTVPSKQWDSRIRGTADKFGFTAQHSPTYVMYGFGKFYVAGHGPTGLLESIRYTTPTGDNVQVVDTELANPYGLGDSDQQATLKSLNPGSKHIWSIGGWNFKSGPWTALNNPARRTNLVNGLIAEMIKRGLDGIDIDWEQDFPTQNSGSALGDLEILSDILVKLKSAALAAGIECHTSLAVPIRTDVVQRLFTPGLVAGGNSFVTSIIANLDMVVMMAYDIHGPWEEVVNPHSSIIDINNMLDIYAGTAYPLSKIIMGIPAYGKSWASETSNAGPHPVTSYGLDVNGIPLDEDTPYAPGTRAGIPSFATQAGGTVNYNEIQELIAWNNHEGDYDTTYPSPTKTANYYDDPSETGYTWYCPNLTVTPATAGSNPPVGNPAIAGTGRLNNWNIVTYDTPKSIVAKAALARTRGLKGLVMWDISGDLFYGSVPGAPGPFPLWSTICENCYN